MKTKKQIRAQLETAKKELREIRKQFAEYDNHEDMEAIPVIEQEIKTLEWVLGNFPTKGLTGG